MLITKCQQRIAQYLNFLEGRRYDYVASPQFEVAETEQTYRCVPQELEWTPIQVPFHYGKPWTTYWFKTRYAVAEAERGQELYLHFTSQAESLVFVNGAPVSAVNPRHEKMKLTDAAEPGTTFDLALETYSGHPYPGMHPFGRTSVMVSLESTGRFPQYPLTLTTAQIVRKNQALYDLYYDAWVLFELAKHLPEHALRRNRILRDLFHGLSQIHFTADADALRAQVGCAGRLITPLLALTNSPTTPTIHAIGHAHIDHAWLWPIRETHRKAARTFACMTGYAREFPEFIFIQSQPAQLEAVHHEYPAIFAQVQQAYQHGQWEPNGGMYVEADCNIPNGESLIRQFLVGRLTTEALLGYRSDTLWLPDVFGYAANLPQILAGCGIAYFVTSKINWNDTTRFPYDTFLWKGIDGTALKTHYITLRKNGYNGKIAPEQVFEAWQYVQHKEVQSGVIFSVGEGDGGGGTMRADLELARRMRDLEGCPKVVWTTVSDALAEIFRDAAELPAWQGELYLELHRGTYTSQAKTKQWNRRLEYALRETEMLAATVMPSVYGSLFRREGGLPYPSEQLLACWKRVLIQQFHDIIPGSSIKAVYDDAMQSYAAVAQELAPLAQTRRQLLAAAFDTSQSVQPLICINSLSWPRSSKITLPTVVESVCLVAGERRFPAQQTRNLADVAQTVAVVDVPSLGGQLYDVQPAAATEAISPFQYAGKALRTPFYQAQFDDAMRISSLIDGAAHKEYVTPGMALNTLQTAEDVPILWDAWDLDVDYQRKLIDEDRLLSTEVISEGPVLMQIRNRYQIGARSTLTQDVVFYAHHPRIDFVTQVDWQEDHRVLKTLFPLDIRTTTVKCEIQYGYVERSTTWNTPADRAKFEMCAHKWIAADDGSFGAALLNDCKYGHDARGAHLRLTLLKSAKAPDETADMGVQTFTYALLPYQGAFTVANVVRQGYELNIPIEVVAPAGTGPTGHHQTFSLFQIDNPNVILETVKKAEQDDAVILRLYEAGGGEQRAVLTTALAVEKAVLTNLLEEENEEVTFEDGRLLLNFKGFEIKTVKFSSKSRS